MPIAFLGLFFILNPTNLIIISIGEGFALLGSLFNAGVYISLKRLRDKYNTVTVVFWTYLISSIILIVPAMPHLAALTSGNFKLLITMSSIGFIGQLLMTLGFKFSTAGISSLFMISIIPLTTLSGIFIFGEVYTGLTLTGMGLIFSSLMVIAKYR
ncbi:MAG: DMT family transporter [Candidatus Margulisiibacteriota bacterium]